MKQLDRLAIAWIRSNPGQEVKDGDRERIESFGVERGILSPDFLPLTMTSFTANLTALRSKGVIKHPFGSSRGWYMADASDAAIEDALLPTKQKRAKTLGAFSPALLELFEESEKNRRLFANPTTPRPDTTKEREDIFKQYGGVSAIGDYSGNTLRYAERSHLAAVGDYNLTGLPVNNSPANVLPEPTEVNQARYYGGIVLEETENGGLIYRVLDAAAPEHIRAYYDGERPRLPKFFITKKDERVPALPLVLVQVRFAAALRNFIKGPR